MKYTLSLTGGFSKDLKRCKKRNYNLSHMQKVFDILEQSGSLPAKYKPHKLTGNYSNCWECHIKPDWLLIWRIDEENRLITLLGTGTHSDLF